MTVGLGLAAVAFVAAVVNGALGYGFSSITVPVALLFLSNRILNPALVLVEVTLNAYVLWVNRSAIGRVQRRIQPIVIGLVPGIAFGTLILARVHPSWLRLWTFVVLLPLILAQAAGYRRPIRSERKAGLLVGSTVGGLYAVTTISGPPLAVMLSNQGFVLQEFRAALGSIRLAESSLTATAYAFAGLFSRESLALLPWIVPSVVFGVPVGAWIIRRVRAEAFRRICMSFDAWVVAFGISTLLNELKIVPGPSAFVVLVVVASVDVWMLYRFFGANGGNGGNRGNGNPNRGTEQRRETEAI
ncbi:MAG TPA: sulfite exporter TauE/SafE family protein [Vicinamibacterales bacterium]